VLPKSGPGRHFIAAGSGSTLPPVWGRIDRKTTEKHRPPGVLRRCRNARGWSRSGLSTICLVNPQAEPGSHRTLGGGKGLEDVLPRALPDAAAIVRDGDANAAVAAS